MFQVENHQHFALYLRLFFGRNGNIILFACDTFAWFTSSDTVTNRLSASADYNVTAIENFTPPKNWIPGQEVKKEVSVVNTGNIEAFVMQQISGKMTVTTENKVTVFDAGTCTKLDANEVQSLEAGSYLAWIPSGSEKKLGEKVIDANSSDDFTPDAEGLYFFRREISDITTNDDGTITETYTYAGYYYKDEEYYKLTGFNTTGLAGKDGILKSEPTGVTYGVETTEVVDTILTYEENEGSLRLVATYAGVDASTQQLANSSQAVSDAYNTYLTKKADSDAKKNSVDNATTGTAKKLEDAKAEQISKQTAYNTAKNADDAVKAATTAKADAEAKAKALAGEAYASVVTDTTSEDAGKNATSGSNVDKAYQKYTISLAETTAAETAYNNFTSTTFDAENGTTVNGKEYTDETAFNLAKEAAKQNYENKKATSDADKITLDNLLAELKGYTDTITTQSDIISDNTEAAAKLSTATTELQNANNAVTAAETANANAVSDYNTAQAATDAAKAAYENLLADYTDATDTTSPDADDIVIYINLTNLGNDTGQWTMIPTPLTTGATTASFYYNNILGADAVSSQLIKSVTLAESVKNNYKTFDFDLNVTVNSAQVAYSSDMETITNAAVVADENFGAKPQDSIDSMDTVLTWTAK